MSVPTSFPHYLLNHTPPIQSECQVYCKYLLGSNHSSLNTWVNLIPTSIYRVFFYCSVPTFPTLPPWLHSSSQVLSQMQTYMLYKSGLLRLLLVSVSMGYMRRSLLLQFISFCQPSYIVMIYFSLLIATDTDQDSPWR